MIKTNKTGFTKAELSTENGAYLFATKDGLGEFEVSTAENWEEHERLTDKEGANFWYFDAPACREAADFFIALAEELEREVNAEDGGLSA